MTIFSQITQQAAIMDMQQGHRNAERARRHDRSMRANVALPSAEPDDVARRQSYLVRPVRGAENSPGLRADSQAVMQSNQFGPHMQKAMSSLSDAGSWIAGEMYADATPNDQWRQSAPATPDIGAQYGPDEDRWAAKQWGAISIAHSLSKFTSGPRDGARTAPRATMFQDRANLKENIISSAASGATAFDETGPFGHRGTWGEARTGKTT